MTRGSSGFSFTVSVSVLSQLVRYVTHLKIDVPRVFRSAGVDPAILKSPDEQITQETYIAIEEEAARISGDPYFGLHMGEFAEPGNYSILGYMMMNCATLREAVAKAARYYQIIGTLMKPVNRIGLHTVKTIMTVPPHAPRLSRHCFEAAFSTMIVLARKITGRLINPLEVGFTSPAPASTAEYARIFGCQVYFSRKNNYTVYDTGFASIPIIRPNPNLLAFFEKYAQSLLPRIEGMKKTTGAVTRVILERLEGGKINIRRVAAELSMSVRTLQNRLKDEGEVFSRLVEEIRIGLAKKYLGENYTVEDITLLLGFAEPSVFRKAFKKWLGTTPGEYRAAMAGR